MTEHPEDVPASFSRLTELRLRVTADHALGCVAVGVVGIGGGTSCLLSPAAAIALVEHLIIAIGELRQTTPTEKRT